MANRRTRVVFPVFNKYEVRIISAQDVAATGRRLSEDLNEAEAAFVTKKHKPGVGWLIFGLDPSADTIAHECFHAVRALLKSAGARQDEETFAYHLDYLVGRVHKFIERR